jgi:hypothetical protein
MTKALVICAIIACVMISCQLQEKNRQTNLNTSGQEDNTNQGSINKEALKSIFNEIHDYRTNSVYGNNLETNYPNLIKKIENLRQYDDNKIYKDVINLIKLYSLGENYSDEETEEINKLILEQLFEKKQVLEVQSLANSKIGIDNKKSLQFNLQAIDDKYRKIDNYIKEQTQFRDYLVPKLRDICQVYYDILAKIDTQKQPKWNRLKQELLQKEVNFAENKAFIKSILLNKNDTITPSHLKAISPIFDKINGQYAIYNMDTSYYADKLIFKQSSIYKKIKSPNYDDSKLILDTKILSQGDSIDLYAYSRAERTLIKPVAFGKQPNNCINDYFVIPFTTLKKQVKKLLFSSTFKLELEFNNYPEIDSMIYKEHNYICQDCPSSAYKQKTFAKLKGYDNIYFASTSIEEIEDTDTFERTIYLVQNGEVITLWSKDYDQFGCACL